MKLPVL